MTWVTWGSQFVSALHLELEARVGRGVLIILLLAGMLVLGLGALLPLGFQTVHKPDTLRTCELLIAR